MCGVDPVVLHNVGGPPEDLNVHGVHTDGHAVVLDHPDKVVGGRWWFRSAGSWRLACLATEIVQHLQEQFRRLVNKEVTVSVPLESVIVPATELLGQHGAFHHGQCLAQHTNIGFATDIQRQHVQGIGQWFAHARRWDLLRGAPRTADAAAATGGVPKVRCTSLVRRFSHGRRAGPSAITRPSACREERCRRNCGNTGLGC